MAEVALGSVQRSLLYQRQSVAEARQTVSQRFATGRKINSVAENPVDSLRAQALTARVRDLSGVKADIGRGIDTLAATQAGLDAVGKLVDQLKGLAYQAAGNEDLRGTLAQQFDVTRQQLDKLVADVSYRGTNLIDNPAASLQVSTSDKPGTELTVDGKASDVTSLGVGTAAGAYNGFADLTSIQNAIDAADNAGRTLRSNATAIGTNAAILQVRDKFTQDLSNTLETGAAKLTVADLNQEGARALAANVRDAFSANSLRVAANSESAIAGLLAG